MKSVERRCATADIFFSFCPPHSIKVSLTNKPGRRGKYFDVHRLSNGKFLQQVKDILPRAVHRSDLFSSVKCETSSHFGSICTAHWRAHEQCITFWKYFSHWSA